MFRPFIMTTKVSSFNGIGVYVPAKWGFHPGDYVALRVESRSRDLKCEIPRRKVCKVSTGQGVFFSKEWGFVPGEPVDVFITQLEGSDDAEDAGSDSED